MSKVKVRFAPSPTGPLHIGGARSALFNYLYARKTGGELVLRIEDTDLERSRREYEEEIITSLHWLGLQWQEGVDVGGPHGPYRQTERLETYQAYARQLLEAGLAYPCYCSEEELEAERQGLLAAGDIVRYSGKCRHLTEGERAEREAAGIKPALRFRVPEQTEFVVEDLVRGRVVFHSDNEGDFIIVKSDGIPTYNFAVAVDDSLMGVTDIVRAEEHLSNTPRQLMIYQALGLEVPRFAHISLILGEDRQKMSKRHGATSLIQYREMGYLPAALFNFLALLGWSPEGEEEILTPDEIAAAFSLERVSKSPAVFNIEKLNWLNQQYIKKLDSQELLDLLKPFLEQSACYQDFQACSNIKQLLMVETIRDQLVCLKDAGDLIDIFFTEVKPEADAAELLRSCQADEVLAQFAGQYPGAVSPDEIRAYLKKLVKENKLKPKDVYMPLRCALTGRMHGPDLPNMIFIWGRAECRRRIEKAMEGRLV